MVFCIQSAGDLRMRNVWAKSWRLFSLSWHGEKPYQRKRLGKRDPDWNLVFTQEVTILFPYAAVSLCAVQYTSLSKDMVTYSGRNKKLRFLRQREQKLRCIICILTYFHWEQQSIFLWASAQEEPMSPLQLSYHPVVWKPWGLLELMQSYIQMMSTAAGLFCCRMQVQIQIKYLGCSPFILFSPLQCSSPDCPGFQLLPCTLCACPDDGVFKSKYCWWSKKKIGDSGMGSASLRFVL